MVRDEEQQPLVGATVLWEGTTVGAVTDAEGKYRLHRVKGPRSAGRRIPGLPGGGTHHRTRHRRGRLHPPGRGVDIESVVIESTVGGNYVKHDGVLKGR